MSRKLIRPTLGRSRAASAAVVRRHAPSSATQAEAGYLHHAIESGSTLVVRLLGGTEIRGRIDYYDRDCIRLQREGQPDLLLRKEKIKYYWAVRDAAPQASPPGPT